MSLLLVETGFVVSEKQFFSICQIFLAVKTVFRSSGNLFFNEFLILASVTDFLSSGNSIPLFRVSLEFLKFARQLFKEKPYSCSCKLIFCLAEVNFFQISDTIGSESYLLFFHLVETYFQSCLRLGFWGLSDAGGGPNDLPSVSFDWEVLFTWNLRER